MTQATTTQEISTASAQPAQGEAARKYVATAPNQIWTWGVAAKETLSGEGIYLFVCEDIYSRYVVGCKAYAKDNVDSAVDFVDHVLQANNIEPASGLVLHSSHGKVMQAEKMLALLNEHGVTVAPKRRGDKPYISGLFSSLNKLGLKSSVTSLDELDDVAKSVVDRYNHMYHTQINHIRPIDRHVGKDAEILAQRNKLHMQYKQEHPERFISGKVKVDVPAGPQYLNKADTQ